MIDTGQKFLSTPSALMAVTLRSISQTYNSNVPNLINNLIHLWYDDTYWSKILPSSIPTPLVHVKVKVTAMSKFNVKIIRQQV